MTQIRTCKGGVAAKLAVFWQSPGGLLTAFSSAFILIHYIQMQLSSWNGVIKSDSQIYRQQSGVVTTKRRVQVCLQGSVQPCDCLIAGCLRTCLRTRHL